MAAILPSLEPIRAAGDAPAEPRRLLVAEASRDALERLLGLLERMPGGPSLCTAASGAADAVRRLRTRRFTAAIVDLDTLHGGWPTLTRLCETDAATPVIVLAPAGHEKLAAEAARHGAQDVLFRDQLTPERIELAIACAVERTRKLVELRDLSLTDALTGLYNRRGFRVLADAHLRMLRRTGSRSLLLVADLDGLKDVNDRFGHAAGDVAIRHAAMALRSSLRDSDVVARYGGDEFVALAHDVADGAASVLLARIASALRKMNRRDRLAFDVRLSIGTATLDAHALDLEAVMARADRELYRNKRQRRANGRLSGSRLAR